MTVGEAVFIRVVVRLLAAVPLDVIVAAADPETVAVTVPEPVFVFVSLLVGVRVRCSSQTFCLTDEQRGIF